MIGSAIKYWIDLLTILDTVEVEMQSHEALVDIVDMGIDAMIMDVRTNINIAGGKPMHNAWRIRTKDGIILNIKISAEVSNEEFELSD